MIIVWSLFVIFLTLCLIHLVRVKGLGPTLVSLGFGAIAGAFIALAEQRQSVGRIIKQWLKKFH